MALWEDSSSCSKECVAGEYITQPGRVQKDHQHDLSVVTYLTSLMMPPFYPGCVIYYILLVPSHVPVEDSSTASLIVDTKFPELASGGFLIGSPLKIKRCIVVILQRGTRTIFFACAGGKLGGLWTCSEHSKKAKPTFLAHRSR